MLGPTRRKCDSCSRLRECWLFEEEPERWLCQECGLAEVGERPDDDPLDFLYSVIHDGK